MEEQFMRLLCKYFFLLNFFKISLYNYVLSQEKKSKNKALLKLSSNYLKTFKFMSWMNMNKCTTFNKY